jgi:hypothetical protein
MLSVFFIRSIGFTHIIKCCVIYLSFLVHVVFRLIPLNLYFLVLLSLVLDHIFGFFFFSSDEGLHTTALLVSYKDLILLVDIQSAGV